MARAWRHRSCIRSRGADTLTGHSLCASRIFGILLSAILIGLAVQASGQSLPANLVHEGAALFNSVGCPQCHKVHGVGGVKGPNLTRVGRRRSRSAIQHQIREGGTVMPAYREVLTPVEIDSLARYLHSLR